VIQTLTHLPHPHEDGATLASHFTDLAPPLNARQAQLEASRCLYCYDAPCVNACPSEIDIPSFIRNIHTDNVQGAAQKNPLGQHPRRQLRASLPDGDPLPTSLRA